MKMKSKEKEVIEDFVTNFEYLVDELENYAGYLKLGEDGDELKDKAIEILKKKLKKMKKADTKEEYKEVIRVKKLLEREGLR